MDALEEESSALSSAASDAESGAVVGCLEDAIMDDEIQLLQRNLMDKHDQESEDTGGNKLTYAPIFNEYISLLEKYFEEQWLGRLPGFHRAAVAAGILDMLLTFTGFLAFKGMPWTAEPSRGPHHRRQLPRTACGTGSHLHTAAVTDMRSPAQQAQRNMG